MAAFAWVISRERCKQKAAAATRRSMARTVLYALMQVMVPSGPMDDSMRWMSAREMATLTLARLRGRGWLRVGIGKREMGVSGLKYSGFFGKLGICNPR